VTLDVSPMPQDLLNWPEFHNGVAAGLRITSGQAKITSTWIVYNKPEEFSDSHAGLLMGLGLQGHLSSLALTKVFDYLSAGHVITSIGLLLGMAVTKRGTMDAGIAKLLSVHIPSLHPPSSTDLEVPANVQTAALLGIGLLYEGSAHRRMTELLLTEIGRHPEDHNFNREGYSLASGLALGLVTLGRGSHAIGLADLQIEDTLCRYIVGGTKELVDSQSKSVLVLEGNKVNIDVTAPGATLALGLMFLKTNNRSIAARLTIPNTHFLLDYVRPDFLMLRVLSRNLILWDDIHPTDDWIRTQIPDIVSSSIEILSRKENDKASTEIIKQAHISILQGLITCLSAQIYLLVVACL
jgi:anaphase-promoting complex subunit 1